MLEDVSVIVLGNADVALVVDGDEVIVIDDESSAGAKVVENSNVASVIVIVAVFGGFIIVDGTADKDEDFAAPIRSE